MNIDSKMLKNYVVNAFRCMIDVGMYGKDSPDEEINATTITAAIKPMLKCIGITSDADMNSLANDVYVRLRKDGYIAKIRRSYN